MADIHFSTSFEMFGRFFTIDNSVEYRLKKKVIRDVLKAGRMVGIDFSDDLRKYSVDQLLDAFERLVAVLDSRKKIKVQTDRYEKIRTGFSGKLTETTDKTSRTVSTRRTRTVDNTRFAPKVSFVDAPDVIGPRSKHVAIDYVGFDTQRPHCADEDLVVGCAVPKDIDHSVCGYYGNFVDRLETELYPYNLDYVDSRMVLRRGYCWLSILQPHVWLQYAQQFGPLLTRQNARMFLTSLCPEVLNLVDRFVFDYSRTICHVRLARPGEPSITCHQVISLMRSHLIGFSKH